MRRHGPNSLPAHLKSLKRQAWRHISQCGITVENIAPSARGEKIPFLNSVKCVAIWMQHPILSETAYSMSQKHTEPFMEFIYENRHNKLRPARLYPAVSYTSMASGNQWFEPYRRTALLWYPNYLQAKNNGMPTIFLHELNFEDGFPLFRYRKMEYFVWTSTLGEFDEGIRSAVTSPAIMVQTCYTDAIKKDVGGINYFQKKMKISKDRLIRGIIMYVAALGRTALVFSVFHGMEGDIMSA